MYRVVYQALTTSNHKNGGYSFEVVAELKTTVMTNIVHLQLLPLFLPYLRQLRTCLCCMPMIPIGANWIKIVSSRD